jgi:hypothetical protein
MKLLRGSSALVPKLKGVPGKSNRKGCNPRSPAIAKQGGVSPFHRNPGPFASGHYLMRTIGTYRSAKTFMHSESMGSPPDCYNSCAIRLIAMVSSPNRRRSAPASNGLAELLSRARGNAAHDPARGFHQPDRLQHREMPQQSAARDREHTGEGRERTRPLSPSAARMLRMSHRRERRAPGAGGVCGHDPHSDRRPAHPAPRPSPAVALHARGRIRRAAKLIRRPTDWVPPSTTSAQSGKRSSDPGRAGRPREGSPSPQREAIVGAGRILRFARKITMAVEREDANGTYSDRVEALRTAQTIAQRGWPP